MLSFKQFIEEELRHQPGSETTQIATTTNTYRKSAEKLKPLLAKGSSVLDYGAGLGEGTHAMREVFGDHADVHGYEPFPGRSKREHTFTDPKHITGDYHSVVSHNVLNVLEPDLRHHVTRHILSLIKPGGHAIIGTRKWSGDVNLAKNAEKGDEEKSIWLTKKKKGGGTQRVYQKGFDGDELANYIKGIAGDDYEVKKISGIAASGVHITRKA